MHAQVALRRRHLVKEGRMKIKSLIAGAALIGLGTAVAAAADLPERVAPLPPPVAVLNWTGFYIGANLGGAWSDNNWTDTVLLTNFNNGSNGAFLAGGQIGGNYQIGNFVIGGEWDADWVSSHTGNGVVIPGVGTIAITDNNRWITTVAARFGYAVDRLLFYGKAGGGWVGNNGLSVSNFTTGVTLGCTTLTNFTNCNNNTAGGWLVGAGAEWAFAPHWSLKFEYDYLGLGNRTFTVPVTAPLLAGDTFTSNNRNVQMVKIGVNYLWNWGYNRY
jgi:outer membrane immunogenic protein